MPHITEFETMVQDHRAHVWLIIFIPALLYYIVLYSSSVPSNWGFLSGLELSQPFLTIGRTCLVPKDNNTQALWKQAEAILYINRAIPSISQKDNVDSYSLYHPLESVIRATDSTQYHFQSLIWRHDPDLGRGYLLISDSLNSGRIWRWEVGGGPITIGRSLFLEKSGCRSGLWESPCPTNHGADRLGRSMLDLIFDTEPRDQHILDAQPILLGSSGMAIQPSRKDKSSLVGSLLVAELGERRIVRVEDNGARTPIVLEIPSLCSNLNTTERLRTPGILSVTPLGHLLFTTTVWCDEIQQPVVGVFSVTNIDDIPSLPIHLSHDSHAWKSLDDRGSNQSVIHERNIQMIFHANMIHVSGLAIAHESKSILVGGNVLLSNGELKHVIYNVPLHEADEDTEKEEEDEDDDEPVNSSSQIQNFDYTQCSPSIHDADHSTDPLIHVCDSLDDLKPKLKGLYDDEATLFFDMTTFFRNTYINESMTNGPALAVDSLGYVYATYPGGLLILNCDAQLITTIPFDDDSIEDPIPTSIALGLDDGYLYVSTKTSLLRMKIKAKPFTYTLDAKRKVKNS